MTIPQYSEGGNNGENVRMGIAAVQPVCDNHKAIRCHFMLSDPIIMKQLRDGIHPTDSGYVKLGKAVFDPDGGAGHAALSKPPTDGMSAREPPVRILGTWPGLTSLAAFRDESGFALLHYVASAGMSPAAC